MPLPPEQVLVVAEKQQWQLYWQGEVIAFEDMTLEKLQAYGCVLLCPGAVQHLEHCKLAIDWKRRGLLERVDLVLGTYKGRHIWTPENDHLVSQWVVHSKSEREVLDSDRLAFVPLCSEKAIDLRTTGSGGYLFMGGRKWREPEIGIEAMVRSGLPGLVISDFCPEQVPEQIVAVRERVPPEQYFDAMARARLVLLPLKGTPVSHGQTDAVNTVLLGRPLVVTAGASCDDYVRDGETGILVKENTVAAWTEAVREAFARADEMAAAARELAREFHVSRYAEYLRQIVDYPGSRKVDESFRTPVGNPDRSEWHRAQQAEAERRLKIAQGVAIRQANEAFRARRFAEAASAARTCLDGPHRPAALRVLVKATRELDLEESLEWARARVDEFGEESEPLQDLSEILWSLGEREEAVVLGARALDRGMGQVPLYRRLATMLRDLGRRAEAHDVAARGLALFPGDSGLTRLVRDTVAHVER